MTPFHSEVLFWFGLKMYLCPEFKKRTLAINICNIFIFVVSLKSAFFFSCYYSSLSQI